MIRTKKFGLLALVCSTVPGTAAAQVPTELPEIQVTATRLVAPVSTVPAAITIISGDELRARGITYLIDALQAAPSTSVVQAGSYGAVASLFVRGGESDYTKVLVDGVPVNSAGGAVNLAAIPLDDVDRIEIVRGPVGVLYGSDAMSGVVQIFTRHGGKATTGTIEARAGTFGASDLGARISSGTEQFHASLAGSRFASDGIYRFNNRFEHTNGSAVIGWDDGARGSAVFTARYSDATSHFPTDGNGDPLDRNQRTLDSDWMFGFRASRSLSPKTGLTLETWSHRLASNFRDEQDGTADSTGFAFAGTRDALLSRRGATLRTDWQPRPSVQVMVGLGFEHEAEDQSSLTSSDFGFGRSDDAAKFAAGRDTRSGFVQLRLAPLGQLHLQLGARVDDNSAFGTFTTSRIGVVYQASTRIRVWSSLGTGFKAPTFSELFASSPYEVGNPGLHPEQSISTELGVELRGHGGQVSLTAFHQRFDELIQYLSSPPGEPTYGNLGAARSQGIEGSFGLNLGAGAALKGHITWLGTAVTDTGAVSSASFALGEPLLRRPAWSGGLTIAGQLGSLGLSATGRWVGARTDVSFRDFPAARTTLPSYGLVDASLQLPVVMAGGIKSELLLRAENLFDAEWQQIVGFPGRGRTLLGGARFSF